MTTALLVYTATGCLVIAALQQLLHRHARTDARAALAQAYMDAHPVATTLRMTVAVLAWPGFVLIGALGAAAALIDRRSSR